MGAMPQNCCADDEANNPLPLDLLAADFQREPILLRHRELRLGLGESGRDSRELGRIARVKIGVVE